MAAFAVFCGFVTFLLLLYYYLTADFNYWKSRGVTGPKPIPFCGTIANSMLNKICIGSYLRKLYEEYPNETMVGMFFRGQPALLLRDAKLIKDVLIKDFPIFPERNVSVQEEAEPLSVHLFRIEGTRWRPLRTRLSHIFSSGKLKNMFHLLLKCAENLSKSLNEIVSENGVVEFRQLSSKYTIDVINSCVFGIETNALNQKDSEFLKLGVRIFRTDTKTYIRNLLREIAPTWLFKRLGFILDDRDITKIMTELVKETIDYRKKNNVYRHDFIDELKDFKDNPEKLGLDHVSDTYVAAQLFLFFAAGFETSSTTISNVLYELAQHSAIQEKVRTEVREVLDSEEISYESIEKMTYLEQVLKETLRKYPPVMLLARNCQQDYTFTDTKVTIGKDIKVYIPTFGIHYDPSIYPDPDVFDPERFNSENMQERNSLYYLPFGTGPRNCIGMRFAKYQVKVGLIKILLDYDVSVCEKTPIPFIINPKHPFMMQANHGIYLKLTKLT